MLPTRSPQKNQHADNIAARKIGGLSRSTRIESLHFAVGTATVYNLYVYHCAAFLDACLRAANSSINDRLRIELREYYNVPNFELEDVQIQIPVKEISTEMGYMTPSAHWEHTFWFCRRRRHALHLGDQYEIPSMYVSNADEVNKSAFYRLQTYTFNNTHAWLDVAIQVLQRIRWVPECSRPHDLNIAKLLPPAYTHKHLHIYGDGGTWYRDAPDAIEDESSNRKDGAILYVHAGVIIINQMGITACVITTNKKILYRGLYVHGRIITPEPPAYLSEAAVLQGMRTLHGWMRNNPNTVASIKNIRMRAGSPITIHALANWFQTGELHLESAAASPLAEDIDRLEYWLQQDLWLESFTLSAQLGDVEHMPWRSKELLRIAEEFRTHALPKLGSPWSHSLPLIPLTKSEVSELLKKQQQEDETLALRQLGELDSVSAKIILRLKLTREIITTVLSRLRMRHAEQVNLLSILCGTRFKYYYQGTLLPTWCPNTFGGTTCARNDSFEHLLICYDLRRHMKQGPEAVDFLILMAKRTKPPGPQRPRPRYIDT